MTLLDTARKQARRKCAERNGNTPSAGSAIPGNTSIRLISPAAPRHVDGGKPLIQLIPPVLGAPAYLGLTGKFLRAVSPFTEAPDAGVLAHLLTAVGTLVGPGPHIWAGGRQPARVNGGIVGPTSCGRKGTSNALVDLLMEKVDADFWQRQRVGGLSSGEGLIAKVADYYDTNEDGERKLSKVEKRLYVVEPEFSRVLASIRREGNTLSQVIREAYDSGNLATLTVTPRQAIGAHISIVVHITPEELKARLSHIEMANGFGNRFLWFLVKSDKVMPRTKPIPHAVFRPFETRLRTLHYLGTETKSRPVSLNSAATALWEEVYPRLREDRPGLAGAMTARGSSMVLRLALVYALLEARTMRGLAIHVEHLEAALAVWKYCEESAHLLFGGETGSTLADKVLQLLGNGPMKRNEFTDHINRPAGEIAEALATLERAGRIRKVKLKHKTPGRPAQQWELVPAPAAKIN